MVTFVLTRTDWKLFDIFSLRGISLYWQWNIGGFGGKCPQKVKISKNTCWKRTSLSQSTCFELFCVKICSKGIGCMRFNEYKNKNNNKRQATRIFHHHVGWHRWNDLHQTWHDCWNAWRNHPIQISNQLIHKCGFGKWLKFHVLAVLRRTPLTLPVIIHRNNPSNDYDALSALNYCQVRACMIQKGITSIFFCSPSCWTSSQNYTCLSWLSICWTTNLELYQIT